MARVPRRTRVSPAISLTPEEAHLLSVIDGTLDERELAFVSGLADGQVADMLERLAMFGLVEVGNEEEPEGRSAQLPPAAPHDGIDLAPHEREEISRLSQMLRRASHYELLGVARDAEPQDIKRAYYRLAPKFHPDRHFGKELGSFKSQIEAIFAALTRAHDTLRSTTRREAYDASLPPMRPSERSAPAAERGMRPADDPGRQSSPGSAPREAESLSPGSDPLSGGGMQSGGQRPSGVGDTIPARESPVSPRPVARTGAPRDSFSSVRPPMFARPSTMRPRMPSTPEDPRGMRPSVPPEAAELRGRDSVASAPRPQTQPPPRRVTRTGPVEQAEREALARKLAGQKVVEAHRPGRHASDVRTSRREEGTFKPQTQVRPSAVETLRQRYDKLGDAAKQRRRDRYVEQGQAALDARDFRAAIAAFEQALRITPDDPELVSKLETAHKLAQ